ncbi:MAG: tyrosine-type recombinase/integrase, partial [Chloroflexi bacterium]|nr:tyrosine-type recombinase/integrase [Chloroflexota bacterium]
MAIFVQEPEGEFVDQVGYAAEEVEAYLETLIRESTAARADRMNIAASARLPAPAAISPGVRRPTAGLSQEDAARTGAIGEHKVAVGTRKNYVSQWKRFTSWAARRGVRSLPAAPEHVAAYLAERSERDGHKPPTLRVAAAAIKFFHQEAELENPCGSKSVREILIGVTRMKGSRQKQAKGITEAEFNAIRETARLPRRSRGGSMESRATAKARGETDIAIIGLMRDALLRVSEAAALRWSDIVPMDDGTGSLLIRRSKTDQDGKGAVAFVSAPTMKSLARIRGDTPEEGSVFGLARSQLSRRIARAALEAGLGEGFSGHSPCVGMAQDLARAGIELPRLMTAGRWRSPRMPALYTRNESVSKGAVAEFYGHYGRYGSRFRMHPEGLISGVALPLDGEESLKELTE